MRRDERAWCQPSINKRDVKSSAPKNLAPKPPLAKTFAPKHPAPRAPATILGFLAKFYEEIDNEMENLSLMLELQEQEFNRKTLSRKFQSHSTYSAIGYLFADKNMKYNLETFIIALSFKEKITGR